MDPIDQAVAAAEDEILMAQRTWQLPTGRPFLISIPVDMTDGEFTEMVTFMSMRGWVELAGTRERKSRPASRIVLPNGPILGGH